MRKNKVISFGLLITAFVFFCNPNIGIIDLLPDCFGCFFIILALRKLCDMCDYLDDAKRGFTILFWINLSKLPAFIVVRSMVSTHIDEAPMWLLAAFCYAIADSVFTIRAFNSLFEGFAYLGERNDGGEFLYHQILRPEKQGRTKVKKAKAFRLEKLSFFTYLFIIIRSAMCTLPEFVYIYPQDYINPSPFTPISFKPLLIVMLGLVAFVFGIVWVIKICGYTRRISKEKAFWASVFKEYEEKVLPRKGLFVMRHVYVFAIVFTIAAFFSVDFYPDEINYLPDFVSAALFFVSATFVHKYSNGATSLKITSAIYFVTSLFTYFAMIMFKTGMFSPIGYTYDAVGSVDTATKLYTIYAVSNAVSQIAFIAVMMSAAAIMMRVVRLHTGINTLTGVSNSSRPLVNVYSARVMRMRVLSVLAAIFSVLYFYFIVYSERRLLRSGEYSYMPQFALIWMADFLVAMIYAIHASNLAFDIVSEVNYKYKYE